MDFVRHGAGAGVLRGLELQLTTFNTPRMTVILPRTVAAALDWPDHFGVRVRVGGLEGPPKARRVILELDPDVPDSQELATAAKTAKRHAFS